MEMDGGASNTPRSLTPTPRTRGSRTVNGVVNGVTGENGVGNAASSSKGTNGRELLPPPRRGAGAASAAPTSVGGAAAADASATVAAAAASQSSANPALDHHIREIESSDGSLSTTIRAIYDDKNSKDSFVDRLDGRIRQHDRDIETMCNHYYQGFVDSIRELLGVRLETAKLREQIVETNEDIQESAKALLSKSKELVTCRRVQSNITSAIDTLSTCLPVLETYSKLQNQMKQKRYYAALKTLEQLEHTYLPHVSKYRFSQVMTEAIPELRRGIKDASMSDLKDFLENIRKHQGRIGEIAMRQAAEQSGVPKGGGSGRKSLGAGGGGAGEKPKKRKAPPPPNPFTGETASSASSPSLSLLPSPDSDSTTSSTERGGDSDEVSAQDLVDFSPVYRCLHIYSVLGEKETFENYYRKQRKKQARLALGPTSNMHASIEGYRVYFSEIVGFFVVEDSVLSTTQGLVSRAHLDELWDMAVSKVVAALRTHAAYTAVDGDANLILELKNLVMLFNLTLRGYGFTVSQLYDLLLEIRDQYNEILMKRWVDVFHKVFDEDNYTPIHVECQEEYDAVLEIFPYRDEKLERMSFSKRFPFSNFVPRIYRQVQEFIAQCLKFSDDLHLSHTEIDDMVRKATNMLMTRTLAGCLQTLIKRHNLTLLQLIQISINTKYLEQACSYLEDHIGGITGAEKDSVHVASLQGVNTFKDARAEAEQHIYTQLNQKMDDFFELAHYDWVVESLKTNPQPSGYLMDLIAFLQSTFMSFTNLPGNVAQTACLSACKHLATKLMDFLLDDEAKQISEASLQQFNLDVKQCEEFAASDPVPGFGDGALLMCFMELRQLLDLILSGDWAVYLADYGQPNNKYLRVSPEKAILLLEKMNSADRKKINLFAALKKDERDKKKLLDTVLKQLRGLNAGSGGGGNAGSGHGPFLGISGLTM